MKYLLLVLLLAVSVVAVPVGAASPQKAATKPKAAPKACVSKIHVIKGCSACETMQKWLRDGGVELDVINVEQGEFALFPTVVYSDKFRDHGERMYKQEVTIPGKLCVVSCSVGTE